MEGSSYRGFPLPMIAIYELASESHLHLMKEHFYNSIAGGSTYRFMALWGCRWVLFVVVVKIRGLTIVEKYGGGRTNPARSLASNSFR